MAKAGFCAECGANVWVNEDGSCAQGHAPSSVSGVYETGVAAPQAPAPAPKKKMSGVVVAVIAAVALFACLVAGILIAISAPVFSAASGSARERQCFSNERVVEGAIQQYLAENPDAEEPEDWSSAMDVLVPDFIKEDPSCTEGVYSLEDGSVTCTRHGNYAD